MAISLQKGQKVSLTKESKSELTSVLVGLGWDEVKPAKRRFFAPKPEDIDCDASAILLRDGKLVAKEDLVYFGNLRHFSGTITHMGDNLTGAGDGDDEQILIDLEKVPSEYDRIVIVVTIYGAIQKGQHFGMIENAFIRIVDGSTNAELCKYDLTENYPGLTAMIFGEIYRHNGEWKFNAIGQGTNDADLGQVCQRYQ